MVFSFSPPHLASAVFCSASATASLTAAALLEVEAVREAVAEAEQKTAEAS